MKRLRGGESRSELIPTLSPFPERTQQVGFDPFSGFRDFRGKRRKASKKGCIQKIKKTAAVPLNKRVALFSPFELFAAQKLVITM
jgi:hypothetical protein